MKRQRHRPLSFSTTLGRYYRALETKEFVYYVNYQEGDENASVIMYRKRGAGMELVSDNYFAYGDMFEVLEDKTYTHISRTLLNCHKRNQEILS